MGKSFGGGVDKLLVVGVLLISVLLVFGCADAASPNGKTKEITYAQYEALQDGMSYSEAVSILGREGKLQSSSSTLGYESKIYSWDISLGVGIILMFSNDALLSKSQIGFDSSQKETKSAGVNVPPPNKYVPTPTEQPQQVQNEPTTTIPPQTQTQEPETVQATDRCDRSWSNQDAKFFCKAMLHDDSSFCEQISDQDRTGMLCFAALNACKKMDIDKRPNCYKANEKPASEPLCSPSQLSLGPFGAQPNYCYNLLVASSNPKELCDNFSKSGIGELRILAVKCYVEAAFLTDNPSFCDPIDENLADIGSSEQCRAMFSGDASNCISETKCSHWGTCQTDLCLTKVALITNNAEVCEKYGSNACYARVAIAQLNETMCDSVGTSTVEWMHKSVDNWRDECYYQIAVAKGSPATCEKIKLTYARDLCFMELALKQGSAELCSDMTSSPDQDACLLKVWFNIV